MKILALAFLLALPNAYAQDHSYGSYIGDVVAKWDVGGRTMTLTQPFEYIAPNGLHWNAPVGSVIDGASIPQFAWSIIGGPFEGKYRDASVLHDVACDKKDRRWQDVHYMFYTAMLASGVSNTKAKIMYAAVYHFGPRWPEIHHVTFTTNAIVEQRQCFNILDSQSTCVVMPRSVTPSPPNVSNEAHDLVLETQPPPQTLSQEEFKKLSAEIEAREQAGTPMGLEDIRDYK